MARIQTDSFRLTEFARSIVQPVGGWGAQFACPGGCGFTHIVRSARPLSRGDAEEAVEYLIKNCPKCIENIMAELRDGS